MAEALSHQVASLLAEPNPHVKARGARALYALWQSGGLGLDFARPSALPDAPRRLAQPKLVPPTQVPRRKIGPGREGRFALLHALAHIELNAINLSLDVAGRYLTQTEMPVEFYGDWLRVADEEAKHFDLLSTRLADLGGAYGDLPAHGGLWASAQATAHALLDRLAVVPLVLEARGLDVTPGMIAKFQALGDKETVAVLEVIYADEIGHVAIGRRWFEFLCAREGLEPTLTWQEAVKRCFSGSVKRPFNEPARSQAGLVPAYYEPLADWYEGLGL